MSNKKILIIAPAWIGDLIISAAFIKALKNVSYAIISIDKDKTQSETLKYLALEHSDNYDLFFANGGDQNNERIPEFEVCKNLGIGLIDGLGDKIQSSSWLLK